MEPVTKEETVTATKLAPGNHTLYDAFGRRQRYYVAPAQSLVSLEDTGLMTKDEVRNLAEFLYSLSDLMTD